MMAVISCAGGALCRDRFVYDGMRTCAAAETLFGGQKSCRQGCLGLGDCERACVKNAIVFEEGVPVVDSSKCDACGQCAAACPKGLICLVPRTRPVQIRCRTREKANQVKSDCPAGCINCGICAKLCPSKAIMMDGTAAAINYERCDACGICVGKCPTNAVCMIIV